MPLIINRDALVKEELDKVPKNKLRAEADLAGNAELSIATTRRGVTFTAYVKALVTGPQKKAEGGFRVEKEF